MWYVTGLCVALAALLLAGWGLWWDLRHSARSCGLCQWEGRADGGCPHD